MVCESILQIVKLGLYVVVIVVEIDALKMKRFSTFQTLGPSPSLDTNPTGLESNLPGTLAKEPPSQQ